MEEEKRQNSNQEVRILVSAIRDALVILRGLIVAFVAIAITLGEMFLKYISGSRSVPKADELKVHDSSQVNPEESDDLPDQLTKQVITTMSTENQFNRYFYPSLAFIATLSFVTGVAMIRPISQWAGSQVECVEKTLSIDDIDLQKSVKICNGGHD